MEGERLSIYQASRRIRRKDNSLYNALRSIYEDSVFVNEIAALWPSLPLVANLRCGLWYSSRFNSTCYFKSTDGHCNNWSFNTSRLNLHVAELCGQKGGCIIVDSTRKGKKFPDSMSKTIPIWTCVLNRAIHNFLSDAKEFESDDWDCSLHLPLWVSDIEKTTIECKLGTWTKQLEASGADISAIALSLKKPLRPLWISPTTVIWLNEMPDPESWNFTPIILLSASSSSCINQASTLSEHSWCYISGAGDDEESWARGLTPTLFWKHAFDLINSGPDLCTRRVADIVEKDRVYRSQRGEVIPQVKVGLHKYNNDSISIESLNICHSVMEDDLQSNAVYSGHSPFYWLGFTNLGVGSTRHVINIPKDIECVLNCDGGRVSSCFTSVGSYLELSMVNSKLDKFSLVNNLPSALGFAKVNLSTGKKLLVCCQDGEDISVCVCLAILMSLFDDKGSFDEGRTYSNTSITKWDMRKRLVYICKYVLHARPSRGNLKQIFSFLRREKSLNPQPVSGCSTKSDTGMDTKNYK